MGPNSLCPGANGVLSHPTCLNNKAKGKVFAQEHFYLLTKLKMTQVPRPLPSRSDKSQVYEMVSQLENVEFNP